MYSDKKIVITVNKLGDTKIDAVGFVGNECLAATQSVEQALAGTVGERNLKPEFDQPAETGNIEQDLRL